MNQSITTYQLETKTKSKSEIYRLLSTEGKVYLPQSNEANHHYISDLIIRS